jgi:hypothetical protein
VDKDFREVRAAVFGDNEHRQLADMRRSGAVVIARVPLIEVQVGSVLGEDNIVRWTTFRAGLSAGPAR